MCGVKGRGFHGHYFRGITERAERVRLLSLITVHQVPIPVLFSI
jgi:hypothetical protein